MVDVYANLINISRNAIRALNINNVQVGHVPRAVAAKLAPLLDQGKVTVEGTMLEGNSESSTSRAVSRMPLTAPSEQFQVFALNVSPQCPTLTKSPSL